MLSIERTKNNQFHTRITGRNGEKLMNGEPETRKANCVKQLIAVAKEFESPWFVFVDRSYKNGQEKVVKIAVK